MYLCQIYSQFPVTASDKWLKHINIYLQVLFNLIFLITVNIRHSEMKSFYLSNYLKQSLNQNQLEDNLGKFNNYNDVVLILKTIMNVHYCIQVCLDKLPFYNHTSDSNSLWIIDQFLKENVELNISVFRLYLDDCDFDLNSNLNTGYQKDANSGSFSKTTINLITCFSKNSTFGKRIPLPLPLYKCLMMQFSDRYLLFALNKFLIITMAFLKLTMNQIMYSPENILIPVWPSAVRLEENKLMYDGLLIVLLMCRHILKHINCVIIHNYIFELIYQTVCPLIDCKVTNLDDIRSDFKINNVWEDLKLKFNALCRPKQFELTFKDYETLSMNEILGKRRAHVDTQSASAKEGYLHVLHHLTNVLLSLRLKQNISSASMGLQRLNKYLSNEPQIFPTRLNLVGGKTYTDEIRSALHFQFAMLFLTPEGLSHHFRQLQENAWHCHPLYSPDLVDPPPHCAIPVTNEDEKNPASIGSISRLTAKDHEESTKPSEVLSAMNIETRTPLREFVGGLALNDLPESSGGRRVRSDRTDSEAVSTIAPTITRPEVVNDDSQIQLGQVATSELPQRLWQEADLDRRANEGNANEDIVRGISLDRLPDSS